jgi:hypothetical protein
MHTTGDMVRWRMKREPLHVVAISLEDRRKEFYGSTNRVV